MKEPLVFISYKHGDPWTRLAKRFHLRLAPMTESLGYRLFLDDKDLVGGDVWRSEVEGALDETTHFVAFLCDEYWLSAECRKELDHAVRRFRENRIPRLLFVLAEKMRPEHLVLAPGTAAGEVITKVGDVHFLGPFDDHQRLVRLEWNDAGTLGDQMWQLATRFIATLEQSSGSRGGVRPIRS